MNGLGGRGWWWWWLRWWRQDGEHHFGTIIFIPILLEGGWKFCRWCRLHISSTSHLHQAETRHWRVRTYTHLLTSSLSFLPIPSKPPGVTYKGKAGMNHTQTSRQQQKIGLFTLFYNEQRSEETLVFSDEQFRISLISQVSSPANVAEDSECETSSFSLPLPLTRFLFFFLFVLNICCW